ncbi:MAG TPA: hypothetical protein VHL57_10105, partial [Flavobacteriales bacterium]|nr:hypothetical protein [Flavobacteriales bacterium]
FPDGDLGEPTSADPCADFSWGETEDYGILIQLSTGISAPSVGSLGIFNGSGSATVKWANMGQQQQLVVLDAAGRIVLDARPVTNSFSFSTEGFSTGIYQVVVVVDGQRLVGRLPRVGLD